MAVDLVLHSNFSGAQLHPPKRAQASQVAMDQNDVVTVTHESDTTGKRQVMILEMRADLANKYAKAADADFKIETLSATQTRVTKTASGVKDTKVNVIL